MLLLGLAIAPWNVLGGGKLRTDAEEERRRQTGEQGRKMFGPWERNETEKKVSHALEKVAGEVGAKSITSGTCDMSSYLTGSVCLTWSDLSCSCNCVYHAEGSVCVPYHWRT